MGPFKMHGFEPQNMFHMVNTMMSDPEFKKLAKNFEDQMKNTMDEFKKAQTNETQKQTENPCSSSSSSPKTTEKSCSSPKTQNSSACPMFSTRMCNPRKKMVWSLSQLAEKTPKNLTETDNGKLLS